MGWGYVYQNYRLYNFEILYICTLTNRTYIMKKIPAIPVLLMLIFSSCQKELSSDIITGPVLINNTDTSKILTLVEYNYDYPTGAIKDSTIRVLANATIKGVKKYIITEYYSSYPGDTAFTVYSYNSNNQLAELKYTENNNPGFYDRDIYTWTGNHLTKIQYDSSGSIVLTLSLNYAVNGPITKVTSTQLPADPYTEDFQTILNVTSADFKPVSVEYYSRYVTNNPGQPIQSSTDTLINNYNLSMGGDLINSTAIGSNVDSNAYGYPGLIRRSYDTTYSTYTRNMSDNNAFTNILKGLGGNELYTLSNFNFAGGVIKYILPEDYFFDPIFYYHPLNLLTQRKYQWTDGVPNPFNGQSSVVAKYDNVDDNQNRLIKSVKYADSYSNKILQSFRIIWP